MTGTTAVPQEESNVLHPGDSLRIDGEEYVVERVLGGNNGVVMHARCEHGDRVIKIYGERTVVPLREVGTFVQNMATYVERLRHHGVAVSPTEDRIIVDLNSKSGRMNIVLLTPFMGQSLEDVIAAATNREDALMYMRMILGSLGRLYGEPGQVLSVGMDLIPRNYAYAADDRRVTYVDLVPPKLKVGDRYLLEWPEVEDPAAYEVGVYRHYDKAGIMHVLLVQMARLLPEFYPDFIEEIVNFLDRNGEDVARGRFEARTGIRSITGSESDEAVIRAFGFKEIYSLREAACRYAHFGLMNETELKDFFSASHFQNHPLDEEIVTDLQNRLIGCLEARRTFVATWRTAMMEAIDRLGGAKLDGETLPYALQRISRERLDGNGRGAKLIIISGPTGVGKSYVAQALEDRGFMRIPNVFTRETRPTDRPGIDFLPMSEEEFEAAERSGAFIQTNRRHGYRHGLLKQSLMAVVANPRPSYMDKSVPSTLDLIAHLKEAGIPYLAVYILPPDHGELIRRITERARKIGQSEHEDVRERLMTSLKEFPNAVGIYDLFLVHTVDRTDVADAIVRLVETDA